MTAGHKVLSADSLPAASIIKSCLPFSLIDVLLTENDEKVIYSRCSGCSNPLFFLPTRGSGLGM